MKQTQKLVSFLSYLWPFLVLLGYLIAFQLKLDIIGLTFFGLALQAAIMLAISSQRLATLYLTYWIFSFTFFALIPWLHYSQGLYIWRYTPISDGTYLAANLSIMTANLLLTGAYLFGVTRKTEGNYTTTMIRRPRLTGAGLIIISGIGLFFVISAADFNLAQLFVRERLIANGSAFVESSSLTLVIALTSRLFPVFALLFALTSIKKSFLLNSILTVLVVLAVFPTGNPRYLVAATYIPLLLVLLPAMRQGLFLSLSLILSLLFVFPFLDQFRYVSSLDKLSIIPDSNFFFQPHFDAYENFLSAIEADFVTSGSQLIGVLLFFVPRSAWPDKPEGSGYTLAEMNGYVFNNISMPFLGEGFVNFGYLGVLVFATAMGYLMARVDKSVGLNSNSGTTLTYRNAIYLFLFGSLFFMLRGDLLSSFAYLIGGLCVALAIASLIRILNFRGR